MVINCWSRRKKSILEDSEVWSTYLSQLRRIRNSVTTSKKCKKMEIPPKATEVKLFRLCTREYSSTLKRLMTVTFNYSVFVPASTLLPWRDWWLWHLIIPSLYPPVLFYPEETDDCDIYKEQPSELKAFDCCFPIVCRFWRLSLCLCAGKFH